VTVEQRFWSKVDKRDPDECWEWTGSRRAGEGHGQFWNAGRAVRAHRFAWEATHGPIPNGEGWHGMCVCHRCDNPPCVNPAHLFLGTHAENLADAAAKGRTMRGERHIHHRLTAEQVLDVIRRHEAGESQRSIARSLGLHHSSIARIFNGTAWAWVKS